MTSRDDKRFTVARAMAKQDGHDPDQLVVHGPALHILGRPYVFVAQAPYPIWRVYAPLADIAIAELEKLD